MVVMIFGVRMCLVRKNCHNVACAEYWFFYVDIDSDRAIELLKGYSSSNVRHIVKGIKYLMCCLQFVEIL